jgi:hypothetical protein
MVFIDQIVQDATEKYKDDISKALDVAERAFWKHSDHDEFVRTLVRDQLRALIHQCRHMSNTDRKKRSGAYGGKAKVNVGNTKSVSTAHRNSWYDHYIDGITLGSMTGKDLKRAAENSGAAANGYLFNKMLCDELARMVPDDQTVRDVVSEKKLNSIVERSQRKYQLEKAGC